MYLDSSVSFCFFWFRKDDVWFLYRSLKLVASPTYVSVVVLVVIVAWYTMLFVRHFSGQNYQSNMAYFIGHRDVTCLPKTSTNCFRTVDLRHHYLPHLNWIFTSHEFMEFIKQYTFQILTLHTSSSFIWQMVRRWQPCCSVIRPCSYESIQNSALFHVKLIKSTQHLYHTFLN